jgi:hypothetical protein
MNLKMNCGIHCATCWGHILKLYSLKPVLIVSSHLRVRVWRDLSAPGSPNSFVFICPVRATCPVYLILRLDLLPLLCQIFSSEPSSQTLPACGPTDQLSHRYKTNSMEYCCSTEAGSRSPSQEIPGLLRDPKVHHHLYKSQPPAPILSQINPIHIFQTNFLILIFS